MTDVETEQVEPQVEKKGKLTKLKEKYVDKDPDSDNTNTVGLIAAIISIAGLIVLAVVMFLGIFRYFNDNSPAYFRALLLSFHAFFYASLLSLWFDGATKYDKFDIVWSFITGAVALLASVYLVWTEVDRWTDCPFGTETPIDFLICNTYPNEVSTIPIISIVSTVLVFLGFIFLIVLNALHSKWAKMHPELVEEIRQGMKKPTHFTIGVLSAISAALIAVTCIVSLFPLDTFDPAVWVAAFYHGSLLVIPAFFAGAEMAYFAIAPKKWQWFCAITGIFAVLSLFFGGWFEQVRFWNCVLGTGTPSTTDISICSTEGFRGYWLPWVFVILFVLELITTVLAWIRVLKKDEETLLGEEKKET
jgi:hypothetical protein